MKGLLEGRGPVTGWVVWLLRWIGFVAWGVLRIEADWVLVF